MVILAVVVANAVIGFIQEGNAEKAMDAIRGMLAPRAAVVRAGERRTIPAEDLAPGDVVLLEAGDKTPADLRLLRARGLQIQEAILTGESVPVEKQTAPVGADAPLGDRTCMAFSGTLVSAGQGVGVVVATGAATEIGRISGMLETVQTLTTPLVRQMGVFAKWLTILILAIAGVLLVFGSAVGNMAFPDLFMAVVGLSVAAIPEGLPAVLTITLAVGVKAMARRNAIVRRLPAIETLGSVSVICTDKTGTLTRNEMMVSTVALHSDRLAVSGSGYQAAGELRSGAGPVRGADDPVVRELARAALLCNDASLRHREGGWAVEGDPMEGALLVLADKAGTDIVAEQRAWARTDAIPFDSRRRYMAVLCHDHEGHAIIVAKGAPERVLDMCAEQRTAAGGAEPIDAALWHGRASEIAAEGQRTLAVAVRPVAPERTVLEGVRRGVGADAESGSSA